MPRIYQSRGAAERRSTSVPRTTAGAHLSLRLFSYLAVAPTGLVRCNYFPFPVSPLFSINAMYAFTGRAAPMAAPGKSFDVEQGGEPSLYPQITASEQMLRLGFIQKARGCAPVGALPRQHCLGSLPRLQRSPTLQLQAA